MLGMVRNKKVSEVGVFTGPDLVTITVILFIYRTATARGSVRVKELISA